MKNNSNITYDLRKEEKKMINDTLAQEQTNEDKKSNKKNKEKKKLPKEISQEILKKMFRNLLKAVGIMLYFIVLNLAYSNMKQERLVGDIEVFAGGFLIAGIVFLERAYKKDDNGIAITGIEFLALSLHSLSIMHVITLFQYDFRLYLLTSSYIFSIYYVLKAIVLYTKGRKEYLNSLSDISEIVKKDEPVKKEAKKRNEEIEENNKLDTKKKASKPKSETVKTSKVEEMKKTKKKTTKTKRKEEKEETKENKKSSKPESKMIKEEKTEESKIQKKKTTKAKTKATKEETEETKTPEKKKRGRPKKR